MKYAKELAPELFDSYDAWFNNWRKKLGDFPPGTECIKATKYFYKSDNGSLVYEYELASLCEYEKSLMSKLNAEMDECEKLHILVSISDVLLKEIDIKKKLKEEYQNG